MISLRRPRLLLGLVLGALVILAAVAIDPAALALLLDVDFLIAIGSAGLLMFGTDVRILGRRILGRRILGQARPRTE